MNTASNPSSTVRISPGLAKPKAPAQAPELPELAKIVNNIIDLDPDYYFRKRYEDIVEAASELPLVIEYINECLQRAACETARAKLDMEGLEADTFIDLRQRWSEIYAEKMTEKALDMAVLKNDSLAKSSQNYSVLKSYVTRLANMQENLRMKLEMMRSVEATKRKLINDSPTEK